MRGRKGGKGKCGNKMGKADLYPSYPLCSLTLIFPLDVILSSALLNKNRKLYTSSDLLCTYLKLQGWKNKSMTTLASALSLSLIFLAHKSCTCPLSLLSCSSHLLSTVALLDNFHTQQGCSWAPPKPACLPSYIWGLLLTLCTNALPPSGSGFFISGKYQIGDRSWVGSMFKKRKRNTFIQNK